MKPSEQISQKTQAQGFYAEPRVYLSRDGEYLIHVLHGNQFVRKHVNFYKKVLGVEFSSKAVTSAKRPAA